MKLLHLADLHIGKRVNEFPMAQDQRFVFEQMVSYVRQHEVDAVLLAGDIYDKATPSAEAVALCDWFLGELARTGAAVLAIPGNHDAPERIAYASDLLKHQRIFMAPAFTGALRPITLEDGKGPVDFWLLPFVKPSTVRRAFPDAAIEDYTDACRTVLEASAVDASRRNVLVAHQFVTALGASPERSDSEIALGGMENVDASAFDAFDYVALGHVHRPQRIGRDTCRYAGSPLKYSFSEARYPKSAPLVTLGAKDQVEIELLPLAPLRDMREIKGPLQALTSPEVIEELTDGQRHDYLRVTLTDEQPPLDAMARLRGVYPNVMLLDYDNARTRAAGVGSTAPAAAVEELDPFDLFSEFYEHQNGLPMNEDQQRCVRKALDKEVRA